MGWLGSKIRKLRRLRALSPPEWWMLSAAVLLLPTIGFAARSLGTRRVVQHVKYRTFCTVGPRSRYGDGFGQAARLTRLVRIAAEHGPYRATCLDQSLVLWWLLSRSGLAAELWFGVCKRDRELSAHAWVKYEGWVLNAAQDIADTFAPIHRVALDSAAKPL